MIIFHYVDRIGEFLLSPIFFNYICDHEKYYTDEPFNIHIQSFINIIKDNNRVVTTKKGKGTLPLFCGNVERLIPIYAPSISFCLPTIYLAFQNQ